MNRQSTEARIAALTAMGDHLAGRISADEYWEMYEVATGSENRAFAQQYKTATSALMRVLEGNA